MRNWLGALIGIAICVGDCNADGRVSIDEVVRLIRLDLQFTSFDLCSAIGPCYVGGPPGGDASCAVEAVHNLLAGCAAAGD